ncbi:hypothetical protein D3C71_1489580 [compost metagenome]
MLLMSALPESTIVTYSPDFGVAGNVIEIGADVVSTSKLSTLVAVYAPVMRIQFSVPLIATHLILSNVPVAMVTHFHS